MSPVTQAAIPESSEASKSGVQPHAGVQDGLAEGLQPGVLQPGVLQETLILQESLIPLILQEALNDVQVADWLYAHPDFFDQHAELLAEVRIRHPHGGRAISLVERQVLVLRERNKALESKMADLIRIGQENDGIGTRLQQLTRGLLRTTAQSQLPAVLVDSLQTGFAVPQVSIRLWGIEGLESPFGDEVSADMRRRADDMTQPYCGPNAHAEAAGWLPGGGEETASIAMLALRLEPQPGTNPGAFGLLVLGSPDAARFQAGMGTAFLACIAEIASASLSRLRH